MSANRKSMLTSAIVSRAIKDSFVKLNPASMMRNPVMFVVEVGTVVVLLLTLFPRIVGTEGMLALT